MEQAPRILLTGGTGFFGRSLLRYWQEMPDASNRPELVCVLTRGPDRFLARHPEFREIPWLMLHHGDILHPETLPQNARFTHLLHAATDSTLGPQLGLLERYSQIVDGTRHMLDYAVANGISRFLLTSSGGVYGPQPQDMEQIPESYNGMPDPLDAQHAYSVAKRGAEHLCALYRDRHAIETVIARCFAFVGRDLPLDVHFAIGNFIQDAMSAPEITVGGDGTPVRSYMDQRDLAHWLITMLMQGQAGQAYNVGSDAAITISELAYLVRDLLAPNKAVRVLGQANSQNFRNRYVPSISKTRSELALELSYTLAESILETAAAVNCGSIAGT